jgi:hypothetical protein
MGGGKIDGATMMRLPAAPAPAPGCPALPAQYAAIRLPGDLKLGAPEAELRAKLGKPSFDKNGIAAFSRSYDLGVPASKGGPCQLSTTAWFRFEAGAATVLQLSHIGAC